MSLVRILGAVDVIISIKTHLKGAFGFSGILDLAFLFIEDIWHEMQKGSRSILSSTYSHTLVVSPSNNDLVDLCPNIWCNNSKVIFFLAGDLFFFDTSWTFPVKACFLYALCNNVTALSHSAQRKKMLLQEKSRMCQRKINLQQERKLLYNCYIRD